MNTNRFELQVKRQTAATRPKIWRNMQCPVCPETDLVLSDQQGVEIDFCPICRGVWLDQGEIDKIVERSVVMAAPCAQPVTRVPDTTAIQDILTPPRLKTAEAVARRAV